MLIKEYQLIEAFKKQQKKYPPILLYGPNEGLVRDNFIKIKNIFSSENAEEINFTGKSLIDKPELLLDEIQTVSMFHSQKIILIEHASDKNIEVFEEAFSQIPDFTLIIILANNLGKTSKIRKFFETSEIFIATANYEDDSRSNSQLIQDLEKNIKKVLDRESKSYLSQNLSTDRMISKNEIDKIVLLYLDNDLIPTLKNIKAIFNDSADLGLNKISQYVLSGLPNKVSINLNKMFSEGTSPVAVIRTMLNYVNRIQTTQIELKKTNNFDTAIKSLKPPVFWKDKDSFKTHCMKWPINETVYNFNLLVDAELSCKSNYELTNILCERALINIAARGQQFFK